MHSQIPLLNQPSASFQSAVPSICLYRHCPSIYITIFIETDDFPRGPHQVPLAFDSEPFHVHLLLKWLTLDLREDHILSTSRQAAQPDILIYNEWFRCVYIFSLHHHCVCNVKELLLLTWPIPVLAILVDSIGPQNEFQLCRPWAKNELRILEFKWGVCLFVIGKFLGHLLDVIGRNAPSRWRRLVLPESSANDNSYIYVHHIVTEYLFAPFLGYAKRQT